MVSPINYYQNITFVENKLNKSTPSEDNDNNNNKTKKICLYRF